MSVKNMVKSGETISANNVQMFPGGKGLNQSVAFAKAGAMVFHAGCIGKDGEHLKYILETAGVNTQYIEIVDELTGQAFIQLAENGENAIVVYSGANGKISKEHIDNVLADFSAGDYLILQNEINEIPYLIDAASDIGMKIVFNPSPINEKIDMIAVEKLDYLILNEHEAKAISGKNNKDDFIAWCKTTHPDLSIVLTLGEKGSIYIDKEKQVTQSAYKVKPVDTTAAGDTFTGYFFANICEGKSPEEALKYASLAASIAVSRVGAAASIPLKTEVFQKMLYNNDDNNKIG